jgi:hypothetical protein
MSIEIYKKISRAEESKRERESKEKCRERERDLYVEERDRAGGGGREGLRLE